MKTKLTHTEELFIIDSLEMLWINTDCADDTEDLIINKQFAQRIVNKLRGEN